MVGGPPSYRSARGGSRMKGHVIALAVQGTVLAVGVAMDEAVYLRIVPLWPTEAALVGVLLTLVGAAGVMIQGWLATVDWVNGPRDVH